MKRLLFMIAVLPALLLVSSCKEDKTEDPKTPEGNDPLESYVMIGTKDLSTLGYTINLYAKEDPFVGYNYMVARVLELGTSNVVETGEVKFMPMMDMGTMMHATPSEQPNYDASLEGFRGTTTFVMPSMAGTWKFGVEFMPAGSTASDKVEFELTVVQKTDARLYNFMNSGVPYFVALVEPWNPEVGINDYEIVIYKRESMMSWPAVTNFNVEIEPEMPSMGHGSPNNVHPVHSENGHYVGKVNFTMTGYWKINEEIFDESGASINEGSFDIRF